MTEPFFLRHRLKLFISGLVIFAGIGGFLAKSHVDDIKMSVFDSAIMENEGKGYSLTSGMFSRLGAIVEAKTEPGSVDRAQGYRYALRQIAQWQTIFFTDFNGGSPTISRCPSRMCKYGFDNPDTAYLLIGPLSQQYEYKLIGQKGTVAYATYQVFGIGGEDGFGTGGTLEDADIKYDSDGDFEILIASSNPNDEANFIELPQGRGAQLVIRQLVRDWNSERENAYSLEVFSPDPNKPDPPQALTQGAFDRRAVGYSRFVEGQFAAWRDRIMNAPVNEIEHGKADRADGGFPSNYTSYMRYELADDEVLILEVPAVDVVYSNIQLASLWAESLVYPARTTSFNDFQAHRDTDDVYRFVISTSDPGVPNWLDATDHPVGGVFMRWQSPDGEVPKPKTKLVKRVELADYLPSDHPAFSRADRAEQLRRRHAGFLRRQNPVYFR